MSLYGSHASWAFSFQWVLQSECRPRSPQMPRESDLGPSRSHPNSAMDLVKLLYSRSYLKIMPLRVSPRDDSGAVRTPLRSPTACAATPPAFEPPRPERASWHCGLPVRPASAPTAVD